MLLFFILSFGIFIISYWLITRGIPKVLSWIIIFRYKIDIQFGELCITPLCFKDVIIKRSFLSIKIDKIGLSSSLYNHDERKLLTLKIYDVRVKKENTIKFTKVENNFFSHVDKIFDNAARKFHKEIKTEFTQKEIVDGFAPVLIKIPPSTVSLAQFFGIDIVKINVMYLKENSPEFLLHVFVDKLKIEGLTVNDTNVALKISLSDVHFRVLQHNDEKFNKNFASENKLFRRNSLENLKLDPWLNFDSGVEFDPSLIECTFSAKFYVEFQSESWAKTEALSVEMSTPELTVHDRFLILIQNQKDSKYLQSHQSNAHRVLNFLSLYWLFIAQKFCLKCDSLSLKFLNKMSKTTAVLSVGSVDLQTHFDRCDDATELPNSLPDLSLELQFDEVRFNAFYDSTFAIDRLTFQTQSVGDRINFKAEIQTFSSVFDYRDVPLWNNSAFVKYLLRREARQPANSEELYNGRTNFLSNHCIGVIVELWHVQVQFIIPHNEVHTESIFGFFLLSHAKQSLALTQGASEYAGELLIEDFITNLGGNLKSTDFSALPTKYQNSSISGGIFSTQSTTSASPMGTFLTSNSLQSVGRLHTFGNTVGVGLCLIEVNSVGNSAVEQTLKLEVLLDNVQLEWSENLASFLLSFKEYASDALKSLIPINRDSNKSSALSKMQSLDVKATSVNIFAISHTSNVTDAHTSNVTAHTSNVTVIRVDSIKVKKNLLHIKFLLEGTKATTIYPSVRSNSSQAIQPPAQLSTYQCVSSLAVSNWFFDLGCVNIENNGKETYFKTRGKVALKWCTSLHKILFDLLQHLSQFVRNNFGPKSENEALERNELKVQFMSEGFDLDMKLSSNHSAKIEADNFIFLTAFGVSSVKSRDVKIYFDDHEIFTFKAFEFFRILETAEIDTDLESDRKMFPELTLKRNSVLKFLADEVIISFPYNYNFSDAFTEDFISAFKWVRKVHGCGSGPFRIGAKLPSDILIQVDELSLELSDDPFEVKLRYNYELMADEYLESCKRIAALEKKIEETRKINHQILSGKIDSLYKILQEKASETYIKRSKKMYGKGPLKTNLFVWRMEDVLIHAFADPVLHGTENVVHILKEIDYASPLPEEGLEFSILWCRMVSLSCRLWTFTLRDYPQKLLDITKMEIYGRLIGAAKVANKRAKRTVKIEIENLEDDTIERSLIPLKFYHDLNWEAETFVAAYGPCWEPAVSQFNIALSLIHRRSLDPSVPLPWWDKNRFNLHGRLELIVDKMTLLLHASLDPYNTAEEMELTWHDFCFDWTNANFCIDGDLNVLCRTASKYDDVRLMKMPNLMIRLKLDWICLGNANDHHSVMMCAPDKIPEYSSNQVYDSFKCFRSQNLKMNLGLETKAKNGKDVPIEIVFYGSTLRWFENLKFIFSGVTRPTRRGKLFDNNQLKRLQLSRHYQSIHLSLSFQKIQITYWLSARVKKGFKFTGERLNLSSEHSLTLVKPKSFLNKRSRSRWSCVYLSTELWEAQIWLINAIIAEMSNRNSPAEGQREKSSPLSSVSTLEKYYFLNITKLEYMRESIDIPFPTNLSQSANSERCENPSHRLVVHNLKGVWTTINRDIVFAVYDSWYKSQQLRRNLRPGVIKDITPGPPTRNTPSWKPGDTLLSPTSGLQVNSGIQNTPSPRTKIQSDHTASMLKQLIAEAGNNYIAYAEDCSTPAPRDQTLQGIKSACTTDDVIQRKWLIQLVNSQVLLKGSETRGYVIISAAKSEISQRIHRPVWRSNELVAKDTWNGSLECMQYYATVSPGNQNAEMDSIMWLTLDNIEEKDKSVITEVTDIVGSGQSVGGVVSETVGISSQDYENESLQLQRIISRCRCEFFYVNYSETDMDPTLLGEVHPPQIEDGLWNNSPEVVDSFTLMHYDVCASTNYLQYNIVVDILNNLLLYIDPRKKEAKTALARMRFKLQLHSSEDQRKPIIQLQNQVRFQLFQLRFLEREVYLIQRQMDKGFDSNLSIQKKFLEAQAAEWKEKITNLSEELAMRIQCYNETQLSVNHKLSAAKGNGKSKSLIRKNEVYFRKAQWRLTEDDGQLGIAQLDLSNFLYSKTTFSDDITEHLLEVGFINVSNLLPNQVYKDVLAPAEVKSSMPVDRQKTLRVYCREKPPCGGISVIEHFEINVVPLKIEFTYQFFRTMMHFCFPYNNVDYEEKRGRVDRRQRRQNKLSSFYVNLQKDDVEIMKQRAEQNKHFVFIKIPELPVNLSYKGKKDKNIEDVKDSRLVVPTLEFHSVTWTWLDLLLAIKMGSKSALVSQAIKHKLNLSHFRPEDSTQMTEEEKAKLLLGGKHLANSYSELKSKRNHIFKGNKN